MRIRRLGKLEYWILLIIKIWIEIAAVKKKKKKKKRKIKNRKVGSTNLDLH